MGIHILDESIKGIIEFLFIFLIEFLLAKESIDMFFIIKIDIIFIILCL